MKDAEAMSKKIQEDAKNTAANEVDRAKKQLREELLKDAVLTARKDLSSQVSSSDQQRLQDERRVVGPIANPDLPNAKIGNPKAPNDK